jgi:hypothetical protein
MKHPTLSVHVHELYYGPSPPKYACLTEFKKYGGTTNPQI